MITSVSSKKRGSKFQRGLGNYRVQPGLMPRMIERFLSSLDCPRALTVYLLYTNGEHEQLAQLEFNPLAYKDSREVRDAYAATKFLSKFKGLTLDYDLDEVALRKFEKFELLCAGTNKRFRDLSRDPLFSGSRVWLHNAIIRKIERILGAFNVEEFFSHPDWGPGASTLIKRANASPQEKFQCETGITRDLYNLISPIIIESAFPQWGSHLIYSGFPNFQVGNKIVTVPKDASTNRVIAIEPGLNLFFQLSIGEMIKSRLLRIGIDLRYQTRNQDFALYGSKTRKVATIDMSSASDSISYGLVRELLPPRWFSVMESCRSRYGQLGGRLLKWEKFSSMGNGFTFQLESLIFYATALACVEYLHLESDLVGVYGDDVVIPTPAFELFSSMIEFYGFQINVKKSHLYSSFRESCGAHFYEGWDCKPLFLKEELSTIQSVFRLANAVRRLSLRRGFSLGCDNSFRAVFDLLVSSVPKALRLRIPETLGDGGFISNFDEASPSRASTRYLTQGWEGYIVRSAVDSSVKRIDERVGYLLAELWRLSQSSISQRDTTKRPSTLIKAIELNVGANLLEIDGRNTVSSHKTLLRLVNSVVAQWNDMGPWVDILPPRFHERS